jgi:hypothetical protein
LIYLAISLDSHGVIKRHRELFYGNPAFGDVGDGLKHAVTLRALLSLFFLIV